MSGPLGSQQWMYSSGGFYPYEIYQSLRFNRPDSAYLTRTPSLASNRKTWTWSGWVKRSDIVNQQVIFNAGSNAIGVQSTGWSIVPNGELQMYTATVGVSNEGFMKSAAVFRDTSAWYHLVLVIDSTQANQDDRVKAWVNGEAITLISQGWYVQQNYDTAVNSTLRHDIGHADAASVDFQGYMAEVYFIDGQSLTPSSFAETKSGVWVPKEYEGTYGTNGFYLPFDEYGYPGKDAATFLGSELVVNGSFDTNTNNWTAYSGATLSVSNKRLSVSGSTNASAYQAISVESGSTYSIGVDIDIGNVAGLRLGIEYTLGARDGTETPTNQGGDFRFNFTSSITGTVYVRCFLQGPGTAYFDNISVKKIITQGNDWTPNNLAATDQVLDSPTNNFCTWNPLDKGDLLGLSEGSTEAAYTSGLWAAGKSTVGVTSGKWYWEVVKTTANYSMIGIGTTDMPVAGNTHPGNDAYSWAYYSDTGNKFNNNTSVSYGATYASGDVVGVAFDADAGSLTFYKNGVSQGVAYTGLTSGPYFPVIGVYLATVVANFGQDSSFAGNKTAQGNTDANGIGDFYYAPPAGYLALCTANLPDTAIDPAQDDVPADYFNTVLYTGTGADLDVDTVGFQSDLVWLKSRSNATTWHILADGVRGANNHLSSNNGEAEKTDAEGVGFIADGFSLGADSVDAYYGWNLSGNTYVAWNWLAGNGTSTNTDGTITSTVSANQKAGFSIVSYATGGLPNATVGHGLAQSPEMTIAKQRDVADLWFVLTDRIDGSVDYLVLNTGAAKVDYATGAFTSSTFTNPYAASSDVIAYCFHSVEGYSKIGRYTGNGSTDGPFVYTGFRPAFVIIKRTDVAGAGWIMLDTDRDTFNTLDSYLIANSSNSEGTLSLLDFLSNGLKPRSTDGGVNGNTNTYIYMAFAEMPFKYSNAR